MKETWSKDGNRINPENPYVLPQFKSIPHAARERCQQALVFSGHARLQSLCPSQKKAGLRKKRSDACPEQAFQGGDELGKTNGDSKPDSTFGKKEEI